MKEGELAEIIANSRVLALVRVGECFTREENDALYMRVDE